MEWTRLCFKYFAFIFGGKSAEFCGMDSNLVKWVFHLKLYREYQQNIVFIKQFHWVFD